MLNYAKTSPESAASKKLSTRQPPAPIFLSDLDNRTQSSQGSYGHENPVKVMEF